MALTRTVYVSIGNENDSLAQARWTEYHRKFVNLIRHRAAQVHDEWMAQPTSPRQTACVAFDVEHHDVLLLQHDLRTLASEYRQPGIAWAETKIRHLPAVA